jgi:hypothetical protein
MVKEYGTVKVGKRSCIEAPPMARQGLPKNAWRKRIARKPPHESVVAASILKTTKPTNVEA